MVAAYDFNAGAAKRAVLSNAVAAHVDAAIANVFEAPRTYLGASQIGDECMRRVQYEITGAPGDPFEPRTRRIFKRGHTGEAMVADWLSAAGFVLSTEKPDGNQHGFATANGRFKGHVDGVVLSGPDIDGLIYPCLWENKALGVKGYKAVVKDGVARAYPKYADQVALYQAYLDLTNPALFTTLCFDTMEIDYQIVPFDLMRAQEASDRAAHVIRATDAGDLLPRAGGDPDKFPCAWCRFKSHCWAGVYQG